MCSRKGLLFLFWCVLGVAGEEDKGQVAMNWNRKKKRTSWVWFAHASKVLSASKPLGDNSVYIFISLRLHSSDMRTAWASDGENHEVSITMASQISEDKLKTRSKSSKTQGNFMCVYLWFHNLMLESRFGGKLDLAMLLKFYFPVIFHVPVFWQSVCCQM